MQSDVYTYLFYFVGFMACVSALAVVMLRSVVHCAFALFFSLFSVAGLFVFLSADFIAAIQLIVYVGGILILILFGILFTTEIYKIEVKSRFQNTIAGLLIVVPLLLTGTLVINTMPWDTRAVTFAPTTSGLGELLLGRYLFPFEIISVILLMIMLGAIVLVRKEIRGKR